MDTSELSIDFPGVLNGSTAQQDITFSPILRRPETDEAFFVLEGKQRIDWPHGSVYVAPGELYVVPRGVEHRTAAEGEAKLMMIEPRGKFLFLIFGASKKLIRLERNNLN